MSETKNKKRPTLKKTNKTRWDALTTYFLPNYLTYKQVFRAKLRDRLIVLKTVTNIVECVKICAAHEACTDRFE